MNEAEATRFPVSELTRYSDRLCPLCWPAAADVSPLIKLYTSTSVPKAPLIVCENEGKARDDSRSLKRIDRYPKVADFSRSLPFLSLFLCYLEWSQLHSIFHLPLHQQMNKYWNVLNYENSRNLLENGENRMLRISRDMRDV